MAVPAGAGCYDVKGGSTVSGGRPFFVARQRLADVDSLLAGTASVSAGANAIHFLLKRHDFLDILLADTLDLT